MVDYTELVKALREHLYERCRFCKFYDSQDCMLAPEDRKNCHFIVVGKAADAIEELTRREKFHTFLWSVIPPNTMEQILEMYHSGDEKEETE